MSLHGSITSYHVMQTHWTCFILLNLKKKKKKSHISAGLPQEQAKKRSFKTASGMHQTTEQVSSQHIKPRQLIIIGHHQGIFAINMQPTMFRLSAKILIAQSVF